MALSDDLARIATVASAYALSGEEVAAIMVTENAPGERTYLCAFSDGEQRTWLALDDTGATIRSRDRIRETVSIAALCELADEAAGDGAAPAPRVATLSYLDELAARAPAERNLPVVVQEAAGAVDELTREVESRYKVPLLQS